MTYHEFLNVVKDENISPSAMVSSYHILAFLKQLEDTHSANIIDLEQETILWRSQVGCNWHPDYQSEYDDEGNLISSEYIDDIEIPFHHERMLPNAVYCNAGRANAKGVAYLYVASDAQTAMSEVRPWIGSYISLAKLETVKKLRIIDVTKARGEAQSKSIWSRYLESVIRGRNLSQSEQEDFLWYSINHAFSKPVGNESKNEYLPTQLIAEFFKSLGFDGIKYKSSLTKEGHNYVLFDVTSVKIINTQLHEVSDLNYQFDRVENKLTQQID